MHLQRAAICASRRRLRIAAASGLLVFASANAGAATDSDSFVVSIRISAPCDVASHDVAPGREGVTVSCASPFTPYRLETGARDLESRVPDARVDDGDGYRRMTLTF